VLGVVEGPGTSFADKSMTACLEHLAVALGLRQSAA
jgi:hypothetical protein